MNRDELRAYVLAKAQAAREAAGAWATADTARKNAALRAIGEALIQDEQEILAANRRDVDQAREAGMAESRIDRLTLTPARIRAMVEGLTQVEALPDPVGEVVERWTRPNGLRIERVRVPMGVIAMIYEARPNVTVDAAALALKTGNAVVLRGGSDAVHSNGALVRAIRRGIASVGLPEDAVQWLERTERDTVDHLITARGYVDLAIPRGGASLIERVVAQATVPVIETGVGNCHVYVDRAADLEMAVRITVNAKTSRPSVCNAAETLLVHRDVMEAFLPQVGHALTARGVTLRACPRALGILRDAGLGAEPADESDWATEYLDLVMAVRVMDSLDEALAHIRRYGTKHSEAIVTEDAAAATRFLTEVDAAAVYHNASTRFTDGFEFGFGAEIGISTQKLHARGPMGLRELTSYKYVVRGSGQVRA
ncbi:MAG: glutamate-5-semialdehyde dehydrogenase [Thermoflavifilum sp.]|nr:glutamate-5-semialdehyde dehydrogenase [Thermoflavifilum sp.]MCL6512808.1 glutamate-5-semialdehyde dehydrogenase [Alicyclobacillus sp.]